MTYSQNNTIIPVDYSTLAGLTGTAAASATVATAKAGYLWGVGYGDRGYGQQSPALYQRSTGATVSQEWYDLRAVIDALAMWQATSTNIEPPATAFVPNANVKAFPAGATPYDIPTMLSRVDTNRANYQVGNMSVTAGPSNTQPAIWGHGPAGATIQAVFSASFADEDHARYFFNTGGEIRFALNHPDSSTPQNASWANALNGVNMAFRANTSFKIAGATGAATGVGYFQLSNAYQTIYNGSLGGGVYAADDYRIEAYSPAIPGVNGGRGNLIYFRVTLNDLYAGTNDAVAAGTNVTSAIFKANTLAISAPSFNLVSGFNGANPSSFTFSPSLTGNTTNYDVRASAIAAGWDQSTALITTLNVAAGVKVSSSSTGAAAINIAGSFPTGSSVTLNIATGAYVLGMGGGGGNGSLSSMAVDPKSGSLYVTGTISYPENGFAGGPALRVAPDVPSNITVSVNNLGTIGGGGGGGGGAWSRVQQYGPSGGGGRTGLINSPTGANGWGAVGTFNGAGGGQVPGGNGNSGAGGNWGSAGDVGWAWPGDFVVSNGGAGGAAVIGNAYVNWIATGTRYGALS